MGVSLPAFGEAAQILFVYGYCTGGEQSTLIRQTSLQGPGRALCVELDQLLAVRSLFSSADEVVDGLRFVRSFAHVRVPP